MRSVLLWVTLISLSHGSSAVSAQDVPGDDAAIDETQTLGDSDTDSAEDEPDQTADSRAPVTANEEQEPAAERAPTATTASAVDEVATQEPARDAPPVDEPETAEDPDEADPVFGVRATAELGFLAVLSHHISLGSDGTDIDYRSDGAQSNLFLFTRFSIEFDIKRRHYITFLYQPLELDSTATLSRDLRIDGLDFPAGTPVRFRYGFPFFRLSWDYDLLPDPDKLFALGLGLQIRNANISFQSLDGSLFRGRNDVGPVPLLRARGRFPIADSFFFGFEVDGFYAPISVLNGSDTEVTGAILDASVRFGWRFVDHGDLFVNVRYLAGGAVGAGDPTPTSDGQQSNWLHFLTVSLGATLDSRR